ncbi:MAG: C1 family peptidase [Kordia sp.]|uniref:C1 family peptidase n=1 Tax=Kordia sp. TaxID=1965332 RepID=UPI003859B1B0
MKSLLLSFLLLSANCLCSQEQSEGNKSTIHISAQTPVKNQGNGNTCSAFGIAAALETLPNMPKDISENFLYSSQKYEQLKAETGVTKGSFLKLYINSLPKYGILTEAALPYPKIAAGKWNDNDSDILKALKESTTGPVTFLYKYKSIAKLLELHAYEYLGQVESKNVTHIKYLLDNGVKAIPVSYELYLPAWKMFQATKYTTITPDLGYGVLMQDGTHATYSEIKKRFPDINTKINSRSVTFDKTVAPTASFNPYGGHVVTIVGYDSEGFIIKNSWGSDWRYYGYERVSFDYHELFAYEALIFKRVTYKK